MRKLLRPSSFAVGLGVTVLLVMVYLIPSRRKDLLFRGIDRTIVDLMFDIRGPVAATGNVVIVDIDDKSLAALGQWPWPRAIMAEVLKRINEGGPRVIGVDIAFAEPDGTAPARYSQIMRRTVPDSEPAFPPDVDGDQALAGTVADSPTVLAFLFRQDASGPPDDNNEPVPDFSINCAAASSALILVPSANLPVRSIEEISGSALSEGHWVLTPDASGICRSIPTLLRHGDTCYPAFFLETVRMGLADGAVSLRAEGYGMQGIQFGDSFVPTGIDGRFYLNSRGPAGTFPYVSVLDLLKGDVEPTVFRDRFVLIGTSAPGLGDTHSTPFSRACPGVEIHATAVDNVLTGDAMLHDAHTSWLVGLMLSLIGGIALSAWLSFTRPLPGLAGALALLVAVAAGNYFLLFLNHRIVGIAFPLAVFTIVLVVTTACRRRMTNRDHASAPL